MRSSWAPERLAALAVAAASLGGCGYALVGQASNIPPSIGKVFVEPLANRTGRSEVEQILTRSITEELLTRRRFTVVNGREDADAVLSGAVTSFAVTPLNFDDAGRTTEYQIAITTKMAFRATDADPDAEPLWSNDRYVYTETYPVESTSESYFDRENLAIGEAAERFAKTLVVDLLEGF